MPPAKRQQTYLDWAATAPIVPAALAAMQDAGATWANPSSIHAAGRAARARLEDAREALARQLAVQPDALVFTSGGTEALGLALGGLPATTRLVSAIEHDAVRAQAPDATVIPVTADGVVDLVALERLLAAAPGPALVAVMQANNETGVIQPLGDVAALVHAADGWLLVDAVQGAGKLPLPPGDFVALSAHKLGGPPGVGALVVRCADGLQAVQRGGGQERGLRAGTENLPGIAGFAAAMAERADRDWLARAGALRDGLEARLIAAGGVVFGAGATRLPTISCIALPGVAAATQVMRLDMAGFAVSAGAACSSGKVRTSPVLTAMGVDPVLAGQAIRISLGWDTTADDIARFGDAWVAMAQSRAGLAA